jgi:hypothetical protein
MKNKVMQHFIEMIYLQCKQVWLVLHPAKCAKIKKKSGCDIELHQPLLVAFISLKVLN